MRRQNAKALAVVTRSTQNLDQYVNACTQAKLLCDEHPSAEWLSSKKQSWALQCPAEPVNFSSVGMVDESSRQQARYVASRYQALVDMVLVWSLRRCTS